MLLKTISAALCGSSLALQEGLADIPAGIRLYRAGTGRLLWLLWP